MSSFNAETLTMYMYIFVSLPLLESTYLVEGAYKLEIIMFARCVIMQEM